MGEGGHGKDVHVTIFCRIVIFVCIFFFIIYIFNVIIVLVSLERAAKTERRPRRKARARKEVRERERERKHVSVNREEEGRNERERGGHRPRALMSAQRESPQHGPERTRENGEKKERKKKGRHRSSFPNKGDGKKASGQRKYEDEGKPGRKGRRKT